jgi:hypothetical protein
MTVRTTVRSKLLYVLSEGEFSLNEAQRTFMEVIEAVVENGSEKVLFDGRTISGEPTIIELYFYGEFAAHTARELRKDVQSYTAPTFAYILHEPVIDACRLGETVPPEPGHECESF